MLHQIFLFVFSCLETALEMLVLGSSLPVVNPGDVEGQLVAELGTFLKAMGLGSEPRKSVSAEAMF